MWKIKNEENKKILDEFRFELIEPLWEEIVNYCAHKHKYLSIKVYIESNDIMHPNKKDLIIKVLNRKKNGKLVSDYVDQLCKKTIVYVLLQYIIYIYQNMLLDINCYNVEEKEIDENLKVIFKDFFYESFFTDRTIWTLINKSYSKYNRIKFHETFCEENDLTICPYCDSDTLINIGNRDIEHFLPKSKYPFLSMHPYNLISSCESCNTYEGKKTNYYMPIISPYSEQIGDLVDFEVNDSMKAVIVKESTRVEVDNYIKLLNLINRYRNENVYKTVDGRAKTLFKIYHKSEKDGNVIDEILFKNYLNYKKEPLTFALKSIYEDLQSYSTYKKKNK